MFYILYKTTHIESGRYYIGYHGTKRLDDKYLGSGKVLIEEVKKYGKAAFRREVLEEHPTQMDAMWAEYQAVTQEVLNDPLCMNIALGGGSEFERQLIEQHRNT